MFVFTLLIFLNLLPRSCDVQKDTLSSFLNHSRTVLSFILSILSDLYAIFNAFEMQFLADSAFLKSSMSLCFSRKDFVLISSPTFSPKNIGHNFLGIFLLSIFEITLYWYSLFDMVTCFVILINKVSENR